MKQYELVFILAPDLEEEKQKEQIAKVEKLLLDLKGKIKKKEVWGKKKLSYPINKFNEGIYVKFNLDFPPDKIKDWQVKIKREEKVIRYLLIKIED